MSTRVSYASRSAIGLWLTLSAACGPSAQNQPGGSGGSSTTSPGGAGGHGGTGGAPACAPGTTLSCYTGPATTLGVGICKAGVMTCLPDGSGYGECVGEVTPKVEDCSTPADEDCKGTAPECGAHVWSMGFGDVDMDDVSSVAVDGAGNVFIAGSFRGTVDFGAGPFSSPEPFTSSGVVAKFDPTGKLLWAKPFIEPNLVQVAVGIDAAGAAVVVGNLGGPLDLDGKTLVPSNSSDVFVAKLDAQGKLVWNTQFGGQQVWPTTIGVGPGGDIAVSGGFVGAMTVGASSFASVGDAGDVFVVKLGSDGKVAFAKSFGGPGSALVPGAPVAVDADGRVALSGALAGPVDFGGGTLSPAGARDLFLAVLEPNGQHAWSKSFGGPANTHFTGASIAFDSAGGLVLAAASSDAAAPDFGGGPVSASGSYGRVFLARLGAQGQHVWSRAASGGGLLNPFVTVAADPTGGLIVSGGADWGEIDLGGGPTDVGATSFVAKLDSTGAQRWSRVVALEKQVNRAYLSSAAVDPSGNVVVAGSFEGTVNFGGPWLTSKQDSIDMVVAKLAP